MAELDEHDVEQIFRDAGAVLEGHFLLTSGRHSAAYWEKFQVLQWPQQTERLCRALADHYRPANVEVVVGPTTGGIILAYEVARQLGVRGLFVENDPDRPGHRALRRGFQVRRGERVLIVDDVLTAGTSIREVLEALEPFQPNIVGIGMLIDRSNGQADFGAPLHALLHLAVPSYAPAECPLCAEGQPLVKPGSRKTT
ncbi:MAG TPA: orotate phosphoribosyltransferase [Ktedonobacterales bacterium]|nr:orotate phosphoribosyltransferase [Ktedonobacterales bacterium]